MRCAFSHDSRFTIHDTSRAFTLIETLVAIALLMMAIIAPMSLVSQSLAAAYYARDQITAYNLAQEGIEAVRAVRDGNILANAFESGGLSILNGIPIVTPFTIDATKSTAGEAIQTCLLAACPPLQTDAPIPENGTLYGYADGDRENPNRDPDWTNTHFVRTVTVAYVGATDVNAGQDAIRVSATVLWRTRNNQIRSFTIYENMYRWIEDGAASD